MHYIPHAAAGGRPLPGAAAPRRPIVLMVRSAALALTLLALAGCASLSADGGVGDVERMTQERLAQPVALARPSATAQPGNDEELRAPLAQPLSADAAVQLALRNNAALKAALAELGVSEAQFVQAGRLRNPGFSFGKMRGHDSVEIERSVSFDIIGLLALPTRSGIERRRFEQAKLQAAGQALQLANATRKAYFTAVAAAQSALFAEQVRDAAEASAELGERMGKAGNWSRLDQARERAFHHDALTRLARARHEATATREQLVRLLGLLDMPQALKLPERLPELPASLRDAANAESQAMSLRPDVLAARRDMEATASALGLTRATRFVNVLDAGYANKSSTGAPRENGYEISLELPLFDWGGARVAEAEAWYWQAVHRTADTAIRARSQVREAYSAYRTSYEIARHYRDEVVPLRKKISEEVLLRYNGMLASVFELLADAREQLDSVNTAIETQRDFWIADTALQAAIAGGASNE